jgi:hypothetical protein
LLHLDCKFNIKEEEKKALKKVQGNTKVNMYFQEKSTVVNVERPSRGDSTTNQVEITWLGAVMDILQIKMLVQ